jgi:dynein light chain Tctex-type 1
MCLIIATCVILQRTGAGFYAGSSVVWDKNNDGKKVV